MVLRNDLGELQGQSWDVVVVGSGYGAGVLAARLAAEHKLKICVLERGREFEPGTFPDSVLGTKREFQVDSPLGRIGSSLGLFDLRVNDDVSVLVGCGLGGTSLINANVMIRPSREVFEDGAWPRALRDPSVLDAYYERAKKMLAPSTWTRGRLAKLTVLEQMAAKIGASCAPAEINVSQDPYAGDPENGVPPRPGCLACGNCITGCNNGAKHNLCMTYLPMAKHHGAKIFTQCEVRYVERAGDEWIVHYAANAKERTLRARAVVLGAGALGSTEILLRSAVHGLSVSGRLGARFSGNGDSLAFGYNFPQEVDSVGFGRRHRKDHLVGPSITGIIDFRDSSQPLAKQFIIEEGAFPGSLRALLRYALELAPLSNESTARVRIGPWLGKRWRELLDLLGIDPLDGMLNHSEIYLVIGHDMIGDMPGGRLGLDARDRIRVAWPGAGALPVFALGDQKTKELSHSIGGDQVHNPLWKSKLLGSHLVTVHPLGGCSMADDVEHGVVNDLGQVFHADGETHKGLFVVDGSIVPTSVGVNPLWTISALAERIADAACRGAGSSKIM
jgi:cholesterol oxidase